MLAGILGIAGAALTAVVIGDGLPNADRESFFDALNARGYPEYDTHSDAVNLGWAHLQRSVHGRDPCRSDGDTGKRTRWVEHG